MAVYGLTDYGTDVYGLSLPPAYLVDPMVASAQDYASIRVTWNKPTGIIFRYRLLVNRYGFPVNENDGTIVMDSAVYPGSVYVDPKVIPGAYHYYGFYVLVDEDDDIWIRSGVAGTLMTANFSSAQWMWDNIPEYFKTLPNGGELTADAAGNVYLQQYLKVLGWGADYLKTQYWAAQNYATNAFAMPVNQLYAMAATLGLDFAPEVPAYTMRKAVFNQSHVSRERGTLLGLRNEVILRTGYDGDVTLGPNILLNNDQSQFLSNLTIYEPQATYKKNDVVALFYDRDTELLLAWDDPRLAQQLYTKYSFGANYNGWVYVSLQDFNVTTPPTDSSSNAWWSLVHDVDDQYFHLKNQVAQAQSTWEVIDSTATNGIPAATATIGNGVTDPIATPGTGTDWTTTSLRVKNTGGSAKTLWARSVVRKNVVLGQVVNGSFESDLGIPGHLHNLPNWVPGDWPLITWEPQYSWGWWPNDWWFGPYHTPAWWTHNNCTMSRSTTVAHTGTHSAKITPQGFTTNTAPAQGQLVDSGFETTNWSTGWGTGGTFVTPPSQGSTAHTGSHSYQFGMGSSFGSITLTSPLVATAPGKSITSSIYVKANSTIALSMNWFDQYNNLIGSTAATTLSGSGSAFQNMVNTATAPSNAQTVQVEIIFSGASGNITVNLDDVTFSGPAVTGLATVNTSSPWVVCPAGTAVTGALNVYAPVSLSSTVFVSLQWFDRWGTQIGITNGTPATLSATTWTAISVSGTAPANTVYCAVKFSYTSALATDITYIDDVTTSVALSLNSQYPPELIDAVSDGIPIPWVRDSQAWNATTRYKTGDTVLYGGQPFEAMRASTGATPLTNSTPSPEWAPLSTDRRIRLLASAYASQNLTVGSNQTCAVIPFVEWFDQSGNFIARLFARNPSSGVTIQHPDQLTFDSFTGQSIVSASGSPGSITLGPWVGKYYTNTSLSGSPALTRTDTNVNFTWAGASPGSGIPVSNWSAQWSCSISPTTTGIYTFTGTQTGGGFRILVNGVTVVDNWTAGTTSAVTGTITLFAGTVNNIVVQYYETAHGSSSGTYNALSGWDFSNVTRGGSVTYESPGAVSVYGGQAYNFGLDLKAAQSGGSSNSAYVTIAWLDSHSTVLRTDTTNTIVNTNNVTSQHMGVSGTAPSSAVEAVVTLVVNFGGGSITLNWSGETFTQTLIGAPAADSMVVTSPASFTNTGTTTTTSALVGRITDDRGTTWTVPTGSYSVGDFEGGTAWPTAVGTRSVALVTGQANCRVGATFRSNVASGSGQTQGVVFRYSTNTNYWRATRTVLQKNVAGSFTTVGTFSTPFADGDRIIIQMNGSAIAVFRNGNNSVLTATDTFNDTAVLHGMICE